MGILNPALGKERVGLLSHEYVCAVKSPCAVPEMLGSAATTRSSNGFESSRSIELRKLTKRLKKTQ